MQFFAVVVWFLCFVHAVPLVFGDREAVSALKKVLFANYTTDMRPVKNPSQNLNVSFRFWMFHIEDVNDTRQTVKAHAILQMGWRDQFLNWQAPLYNGTTVLLLPNYVVWTPPITLQNSAVAKGLPFVWNMPVRVAANGQIYATMDVTLQTTCAFDFSNYPYDVQRCPLVFGFNVPMSQVRFGDTYDPVIRLHWGDDKNDTDKKLTASNWDMDGLLEKNFKYYTPTGWRDTLDETPLDNAIVFLEIWMVFRRRVGHFFYSLILPAVATSVLTVVATLPMETASSLGLLLMNLIIQSLFLDDLLMTVPKSIGLVPKIVHFYAANLIMTVVAIFYRLLIQWISNKQSVTPGSRGKKETIGEINIDESLMEKSSESRFANRVNARSLSIFFVLAYIIAYAVCMGMLLS